MKEREPNGFGCTTEGGISRGFNKVRLDWGLVGRFIIHVKGKWLVYLYNGQTK